MAYFDYNISSSSATSSDGDDSTGWSSSSVSAHDRLSTATSHALVGSFRLKGAHIHSLALKDGFLYTGSGNKDIRVWKDMLEFSGFVKAIVVAGERIFTGHQDGRIRVWKMNDGAAAHEQIGTLPTLMDVFRGSMPRPKNYVNWKHSRAGPRIKHADAVSCLSVDEEAGLLYSSSWNRTFKVWDINNSKCVESVAAHDDAVNAVVATSTGLIYTGSADGTMKEWRKEPAGHVVRHFLWRTLLCQDSAVTALAVVKKGSVVYCGSSDGLLNFWEVKKKEISHGGIMRGHRLAVLCLVAAGKLVLSGAADNRITVWRRDGWKHTSLAMLFGHTGPVKCLAVEADDDGGGKWNVYSGSLDNSVKVWSVSETLPICHNGNVNSDHLDTWDWD